MTTPTKAEALDALRALNDYFREHPQPYDVMGDLNIVQRYVESSTGSPVAKARIPKMGMFDNVNVNVPLPDGLYAPGTWFQTKDFACMGETYTITKEGYLLGPNGQWMEFCGWFVFYALSARTYEWHEYRAGFTNGELISIDLVPDPRQDKPADASDSE